jgi:hypothetical protein
MSIPEACIKAAKVFTCELDAYTEPRARRVILALAENLPERAVSAAEEARAKHQLSVPSHLWDDEFFTDSLRVAIAAFLNHVAGDRP